MVLSTNVASAIPSVVDNEVDEATGGHFNGISSGERMDVLVEPDIYSREASSVVYALVRDGYRGTSCDPFRTDTIRADGAILSRCATEKGMIDGEIKAMVVTKREARERDDQWTESCNCVPRRKCFSVNQSKKIHGITVGPLGTRLSETTAEERHTATGESAKCPMEAGEERRLKQRETAEGKAASEAGSLRGHNLHITRQTVFGMESWIGLTSSLWSRSLPIDASGQLGHVWPQTPGREVVGPRERRISCGKGQRWLEQDKAGRITGTTRGSNGSAKGPTRKAIAEVSNLPPGLRRKHLIIRVLRSLESRRDKRITGHLGPFLFGQQGKPSYRRTAKVTATGLSLDPCRSKGDPGIRERCSERPLLEERKDGSEV
ncbi:hypothetical protein BV25DRAFT_1837431 [Artomyces pyxidatus]|uniref:Uncharacterized protein n=1 Tax=Artomyces pyxidatus TaxID=48021 RepID=A0ACB8T5W2_9AGAM|nr:hypothetical protein BV25DRAFT_1837431 [Artomyces pyxidatus]